MRPMEVDYTTQNIIINNYFYKPANEDYDAVGMLYGISTRT